MLGFDRLECQDLAAAIQVAADHPLATRCALEIHRVDPDAEPPGAGRTI